MNPTTDKLIEGCSWNHFENYRCEKKHLCQRCEAQLQGRLDVLEEWHTTYALNFEGCKSNMCNCKIKEEIAKIKGVLK